MAKNVHLDEIQFIQLPVTVDEQTKAGRCCDCDPEIVLADVLDDALIKNDFTSFAHKKQIATETCVFEISKDGVLLPNLGVDYPAGFPHEPDVVAFTFNWRQYLTAYGAGCYSISKITTPAGSPIEQHLRYFQLQAFSIANSEGTTRILYQNNFVTQFEEEGVVSTINYADSGYQDCYRFRGMFGWWQPNVAVTNHYAANRTNRTANIISKEKYSLKMIHATQCMVERLHKITMHASVYQMSDHNDSNPQQKAIIINCILDAEATETIDYNAGSRIMGSELILTKQHENSVSRFDGSNVMPQGVTAVLQTIGGGGGGACLPATATLDGSALGTIASGATTDFHLVDQSDVTIVPTSIIAGTIKVNVGGACSSKKLLVTGQTVSYGDDDITRGRAVDFFVLDYTNEWGHDFRFVGQTGGYTDGATYFDVAGVATSKALAFPNDIIYDFTSRNSTEILTYYIGDSLTYRGYNDAKSVHLLSTFGGLTGWHLWNIKELDNVISASISSYQMDYPPFDFGAGNRYFITSTSDGTYCVYADLGGYYSRSVTSLTNALLNAFVRYTTLIEMGL